MREIKFRGKRVDNGEWIYGYIKKTGSEWWILNETTDWDSTPPLGLITQHKFKVIPESVGQFTSLHDKNGKEIYEGDVVKVEDYVAVIEWDIGTCRFVLNIHGEHLIYDFDNFYSKELEVIGTIYDNPSLLEVQP